MKSGRIANGGNGMILDGRQQASLTMAKLMKPFPVDWERQEGMLLETCSKWLDATSE